MDAANRLPPAMSCRAYAKRRGVTPMSVSVAISSGRLKASVARAEDGRVIGITDPFLADREWEANSDMSRAPAATQDRAAQIARDNAVKLAALEQVEGFEPVAPPAITDEPQSQGDAAAAEKYWKSKLAELQFREKAGELVLASSVERKLTDVFAACRSRLLALPSRARQELPELTLPQVEKLESLVREVSADLVLK